MKRTFYSLLKSKFCTNKRTQIFSDYNKKIQEIQTIEEPSRKQYEMKMAAINLNTRLSQLQKQSDLAKVKEYLVEGLHSKQQPQQVKVEHQDEDKQYIPVGLIIKKLKFFDKKVLMLGVDEENEDHCIYVKKIAEKMGSKVVHTALPPDMPYFIKTEHSFVQEWKKFVSDSKHAQDCNFYLNPSPRHISECALDKTQRELVRESLNKSKQFNEIYYTIMQYSKKIRKFVPNALLTPLLINDAEKVYFCDYPILKERELWAMTIPIDQLRTLFQIYHREAHKSKESLFDPRILFPKAIIQQKFQYMANAIKYSTYETTQPSLFVCPAEYSELFCMEWKKDLPVSPFTNYSLTQKRKPVTFIEFVQKLVIMDIMMEPVIGKYFIKNVTFPYTTYQTLGGRQNIGKVFIVWNHFDNTYRKALAKEPED